ncbi:hypothetical protein KW868_13495 [Acinetobacter guillouiae]|uniref:Uncharacterized protein n=1 Tax=Acinetobacter guillouiae TaxID=106649 RepID=A0A8X8KF38_ACIGI|nr:hypothetical protein [Acinetobacter guillouiae]MCF0265465.1 hypothetical protein [Acinetobacter guillouiae]
MKLTKETAIAINTIATLAVATSVVMAATFILFYYLNSSTGIKDAWSTIASFFGGFTTLTAAYIASKLFNDWRDEQAYLLAKELSLEIWTEFDSLYMELVASTDYYAQALQVNKYFKGSQKQYDIKKIKEEMRSHFYKINDQSLKCLLILEKFEEYTNFKFPRNHHENISSIMDIYDINKYKNHEEFALKEANVFSDYIDLHNQIKLDLKNYIALSKKSIND